MLGFVHTLDLRIFISTAENEDFNRHKDDGDPEGELPGNNGEGDRENSEGDCIVGKGQCPVLKGEPLGEEEPDLFVSVFVSSISVLGSTFPTNTKNRINRVNLKINFKQS